MAHEILNANPYAFSTMRHWKSGGPGRCRCAESTLARPGVRSARSPRRSPRSDNKPGPRCATPMSCTICSWAYATAGGLAQRLASLCSRIVKRGRATVASWQAQRRPAGHSGGRAGRSRQAMFTGGFFAPAIALPLGFAETVASPEDAVKNNCSRMARSKRSGERSRRSPRALACRK